MYVLERDLGSDWLLCAPDSDATDILATNVGRIPTNDRIVALAHPGCTFKPFKEGCLLDRHAHLYVYSCVNVHVLLARPLGTCQSLSRDRVALLSCVTCRLLDVLGVARSVQVHHVATLLYFN